MGKPIGQRIVEHYKAQMRSLMRRPLVVRRANFISKFTDHRSIENLKEINVKAMSLAEKSGHREKVYVNKVRNYIIEPVIDAVRENRLQLRDASKLVDAFENYLLIYNRSKMAEGIGWDVLRKFDKLVKSNDPIQLIEKLDLLKASFEPKDFSYQFMYFMTNLLKIQSHSEFISNVKHLSQITSAFKKQGSISTITIFNALGELNKENKLDFSKLNDPELYKKLGRFSKVYANDVIVEKRLEEFFESFLTKTKPIAKKIGSGIDSDNFNIHLTSRKGFVHRNMYVDRLEMWKDLYDSGLQVEPIEEIYDDVPKGMEREFRGDKIANAFFSDKVGRMKFVKSKVVGTNLDAMVERMSPSQRLSIARQMLDTLTKLWKKDIYMEIMENI